MGELRTFRGAGGVRLVGEIEGAPRLGAVLLAHGGGQTRHAWSGSASKLAAAGFEVVALDLRGHGESEWAQDGDYRIGRFAEDLVAVASDIRAPCALVGASLGGLAGLTVETVIAPGTFSSLTLVDITPRMEASGVAKIMGFMGENLEEGFATLEDAADAIAAYMPHRPRPADLSGLAKNMRVRPDGRYGWHWDPSFVSSVAQSRSERSLADFEAEAARLTIPVHLVRGRMSELVSQDAVDAFLATVPHAAFTDVAGAGHMVAGDRNDAFTAAVVSFLVSPESQTHAK